MVSFGPLYAVVEPSDHQWGHERLIMPSRATRSLMEAERWAYIGSWFPFRYHKRPLGDAPAT